MAVDPAKLALIQRLLREESARQAPPRPAGPPAVRPEPRTRTLPCVHRGDEVRRVACSTCQGTVMLRVFACAAYGECALAKGAGVRVCEAYPDRRPPAGGG